MVVASGALALAAACASLSGLAGGDGSPLSNVEGGTETAPPVEAGPPPDPCRHATYPPPPATDDDPNTALPPLVVALRDQSLFGTVDGGAPIGFDLDGVCTCFSDKTTAHAGSPSCVAPEGGASACDEDGGVDRQISSLLAAYTVSSAAGSTGGPTLLIKMTKYNGRANDSEVFVGYVASTGIFDRTGCTTNDDASAPYPPTWRGCDKFAPETASVLPSTTEPLFYLPGYVSDHVLVVQSSAKPVTFVVGNARLVVTDAVLVVRLTAVDAQLKPIEPPPAAGDRFHFEGTSAGRVNTTEALRAIARGQALADGGPLCGFPNFFDTVKHSFVCPSADISTSSAQDFAGAECDALSFAAAFTADPVLVGTPRKASQPSCADPDDPAYAKYFDCAQ